MKDQVGPSKKSVLIEQIPLMTYIICRNGKILNCNELALKSLGYKKRELVGKYLVPTLYSAESQKKAKKLMVKWKKEGILKNEELTILKKDGTEVDILLNVSSTLDEKGKINHSVLTQLDITERKKIDNKYATLYDSSRDAIMTLSPPDWFFTAGNKSTLEMFRAKNEKDFTSRGPWEYSPEKQPDGVASKDKAKEMIMAAMEQGSFLFDWTHKRLNGEEFPATVLLTKVKFGDEEFLQATVRDVTENKKAEEKVKSLDELKNRFISSLTNISRTPLNEVRWGLESLNSGDFGSLTNEQNKFIKKTLESEKAVLHLITNMVTSLDIERGSIVFEKSPYSILSLANSVIQEHEDELKLQQLTLLVKPPKEEYPLISIDSEKITKAVDVLVDNAINYSPKQTKITVSFVEDNGFIGVMVKDEGIGIPKLEQKNIFQRFFRSSNAQRMHPQGVGLGLSIARAFVEGHGGEFGFESTYRKGSTFWFKIPINKTKLS